MRATTGELLHTPRGVATIVLEGVAYAAMLPFMYIELRSIQEYRKDWLNAWNVLDVLAYITQVRPPFLTGMFFTLPCQRCRELASTADSTRV